MNYRIKLSHLSIDGFRGFGQPIDLSFDERLTVLIGANGTGKSTILDALAMGMMYLRSEITGGKMFDFPLPLDPVKNKNYDVNNDHDSFENVLDLHFTRFDVDEVANTLVNFDNDTLSKDSFVLRGTPTTTSNMEGYLTPDGVSSNQGGDLDKLLRHFGYEKLKRKLTNVPILVYYGCNSITTDTAQTTIDGTARLTHLDMFDTYKQSLEAREFNFGQLLLMLDRRQKIILQNGEKNDRFLDALEVAITGMLNDTDGATYGRLRIYYGALFDEPMMDKTIHEKTTHLYLNQLSSGEKSLLGLVADLTRRLYLANTEGDLLHGEGIVLIDEIDLHLHPKWQREVLTKLREIFPNVQFVVTTHSPLVLSSFIVSMCAY